MVVPLKYLSNSCRITEIPLINCEVTLQLKWSAKCFLKPGTVTNQVQTFTITNTKLHVPVVTSSTQDNVKLLQQSECGFKRTSNWDQSKVTLQKQNRYLHFLIDPSFQGVNRLFVLLC